MGSTHFAIAAELDKCIPDSAPPAPPSNGHHHACTAGPIKMKYGQKISLAVGSVDRAVIGVLNPPVLSSFSPVSRLVEDVQPDLDVVWGDEKPADLPAIRSHH